MVDHNDDGGDVYNEHDDDTNVNDEYMNIFLTGFFFLHFLLFFFRWRIFFHGLTIWFILFQLEYAAL